MLGRTVAAAGLVLLLLVPLAHAQGTVSAQNQDNWIEADYLVTFQDFATLDLNATLRIHKATVDGDAYTADDMRDTYNGASRFSKKIGEEFITQIENEIRAQFESGLAKAFPNAERQVTEARVDRATLTTGSGGDAYNPTVNVILKATVTRDRASMGLGDLDDDAVMAAFEAGADVTLDMSFVADPGFKNTYRITPPTDLSFAEVDPGIITPAERARIVVDNLDGATDERQPVTLTLTDPNATAPTAEDVDTAIEVAIETLRLGPNGLPLRITLGTDIRAIGLADLGANALPESVHLDYLSADGFRRLKDAGAIDASAIASAEQSLIDRLQSRLGSLGDNVTATGGFDAASLAAGAADDAPIVFRATAEAAKTVPGMEGKKSIAPVFDLGARVTMPLTLVSDASRDLTFSLSVPQNLRILEATGGGEIAADGTRLSYLVPAGSAAPEVEVTLGAADAPTHHAEDARLSITIDLYDIDVSVTKAAGGDFGSLLANVEFLGELGVIRVPEELKSSLPEGVDIEYLSADGIRGLLEAGFITQAQLDELNAQLLAQADERIGQALGDDVNVEGGFDAATLSADAADGTPIVFSAKASIRKSLAGGSAPQAQAAINLYTAPPQTFSLPRIEDRETTYTFILPKGLALVDVNAPGAETQTQKVDGRDSFSVTPEDEQSDVQVTMAVTSTFVLAKFWPVLLIAGALLALLIGGPIAIAVAKRKADR